MMSVNRAEPIPIPMRTLRESGKVGSKIPPGTSVPEGSNQFKTGLMIRIDPKRRFRKSEKRMTRKNNGGMTIQFAIKAKNIPMHTTIPNSLKPLKWHISRLNMANMLVAAPDNRERPEATIAFPMASIGAKPLRPSSAQRE